MKPYSMMSRNKGFRETFRSKYPDMKVIPIVQPKKQFSIPGIWNDFMDLIVNFIRPRKVFKPAVPVWNPTISNAEAHWLSKATRRELVRHGRWRGPKGRARRRVA